MNPDESIRDAIMHTYTRAAQDDSCDCRSTDYTRAFRTPELDHIPDEVLTKNFGCGVPDKLKDLAPGQTVLDLGPGLGRDCFIAARKVGETGRVFGLDMNAEMLTRARMHADAVSLALGYSNVEFLTGRFDEAIPLPDASVDVILSNCVANLAQDKRQAYREMYRVLKPGATLSFSDVVSDLPNPEILRNHPQAVANCIGGVLSFEELRHTLVEAGFEAIQLKVDHPYRSGSEVFKAYFADRGAAETADPAEFENLNYYSVNIFALKHKYADSGPETGSGCRAMYHGPGQSLDLDSRPVQRFMAGVWVEVNDSTAWLLAHPTFARSFTVIGMESDTSGECCEPGCC